MPFWIDRLADPKAAAIDLEAGTLFDDTEEYRRLLRQIGPDALRVTDKAPSILSFSASSGSSYRAPASFIAGARRRTTGRGGRDAAGICSAHARQPGGALQPWRRMSGVGRLEKAVANLQRAVELRPGLEVALTYRAHAFLHLGRELDAVITYRRLSRKGRGPARTAALFGQALAIEGKWDEAEKELRRQLVQAPTHAEARYLLAELLSERGMLDEAAQHLVQVGRNSPGRVPTTNRGEAHDGRGSAPDRAHARGGRAAQGRLGSATQGSLRLGQGVRRSWRLR